MTSLTKRQRAIFPLIVAGMSNQQIADRCFITERTAEWHVANILHRLGLTRREVIAAFARDVDTRPPDAPHS